MIWFESRERCMVVLGIQVNDYISEDCLQSDLSDWLSVIETIPHVQSQGRYAQRQFIQWFWNAIIDFRGKTVYERSVTHSRTLWRYETLAKRKTRDIVRVGRANRQLHTTINGNGETLTRAGVEREGVDKSKSFAAFLHFKQSDGKSLRDTFLSPSLFESWKCARHFRPGDEKNRIKLSLQSTADKHQLNRAFIISKLNPRNTQISIHIF